MAFAVRRYSMSLIASLMLIGSVAPRPAWTATPSFMAFANHTYEVKIRFDGKVSTTQVQASDAGHAKKLVQAQYGPKVTVLGVKKID
jgi:hypothetical protein